MRVAVIDVGSNTARLLVADVGADESIVPVAEERSYLRLGAEIERTGTLGERKIAEAAETCGAFARRARELGTTRSAVIVTAPGRQGASAAALTAALGEATGLPVRALTADGEGRLAYDGAVARATGKLPEVVAVVDVGGGSTEIAVGTPLLGAAWIRSADIGSLRLTRAHLHDDPPTAAQVAAATDAVAAALAGMQPPVPDIALAVGGSARAIARIVGRRFGRGRPPGGRGDPLPPSGAKVARTFGITPERVETLLAGALLLAGAGRALGTSFELGRGGLREGAALELASAREAVRAA